MGSFNKFGALCENICVIQFGSLCDDEDEMKGLSRTCSNTFVELKESDARFGVFCW